MAPRFVTLKSGSRREEGIPYLCSGTSRWRVLCLRAGSAGLVCRWWKHSRPRNFREIFGYPSHVRSTRWPLKGQGWFHRPRQSRSSGNDCRTRDDLRPRSQWRCGSSRVVSGSFPGSRPKGSSFPSLIDSAKQ